MDGACWVCFCCWHSPVEDMNVRSFWVRAMKCMCAQTRPQFIFSFERVLGEWSQNDVISKAKIPSTGKNLLRGESNPWRYSLQDCKPNTLTTNYSEPWSYLPTSSNHNASYWHWRPSAYHHQSNASTLVAQVRQVKTSNPPHNHQGTQTKQKG